jgi:hypothetical protein
MATLNGRGGWDITDEEAAEVARASGWAAEEEPPDLTRLPWRTGRKNPRTIYVMLGEEASDDDPFIGTLDTAELVAEAVSAHNFRVGLNRVPVHPAT